MNTSPSPAPIGRVASLHLHPREPGDPFQTVNLLEVIEGKGIQGEPRYFGRLSRRTGKPSRRHISLIEREQISEHAAALGLQSIPPGAVRSNIETLGIDLVPLIGRKIQVGGAILFLYEARTPCHKMDALCAGLRELMSENRQGVLAEVISSGIIRIGDGITLRD